MTINEKVTSKYFNKKEIAARNKSVTLIYALNITPIPNFELWKSLTNELLTIQNKYEMLCDSWY